MARPGQNRFGAQQAAAPAAGVQQGRNRGPGMNRGGGPGRKKGIPKGGTYGGKAGEALTNTDPESYIIGLMQNAGLYQNTATPQAQWMRDKAIQDMMGGYAGASALNQNLSVEDYFRNTYGTGYGGKKGKNFQVGNLSQITGPLAEQWLHQEAEQDPLGVATRRLAQQGGWAGGGAGNQDFQTFYTENFVPQMMGEMATARGTNPQLSFDQFLNNTDVAKRARKAYAYRSPLLRAPAPIDPTGRYSWWA